MPEISPTFTIKSELDGRTFKGRFADGAPIVTDGYAGWQVVSRPKNVGVVEWQGRNPMAIEIPFIIDYWLSNDETPGIDCEADVTDLERLAGIGGHTQPPVCTVDGQGAIPHDYSIWKNGRWVIESISWDRSIELRSSFSGRRIRCGGTLTIRQFVVAQSIIRTIGPKSRASAPSVYIVKKGDTLGKIAGFYYHDPNKWKIIGDANKIRDRRHLKVGDHLKIPRL